jgi:hypothetical protein
MTKRPPVAWLRAGGPQCAHEWRSGYRLTTDIAVMESLLVDRSRMHLGFRADTPLEPGGPTTSIEESRAEADRLPV